MDTAPLTLDDSISHWPAWPAISAAAEASKRAVVLPCELAAANACLEQLQVTTRSSLGALAHETGGLLIDHGWLRIHGSGNPQLPRALGSWNAQLGIPLADFMLVADDVVGGAFAINGGALGEALGNVFYFSPDTLAWEDTGHDRHAAFLQWAFDGDLEMFYGTMRWPGWELEVAQVGGHQALSLYPPPWTVEGKDLSKVSRRAVPVEEHWRLQQEAAAKLAKIG